MRSNRFLLAGLAVLFVAIFAGCSSDKVVDAGTSGIEEQAIADAIDLLAEFDHDVVSHTTPDTTAAVSASAAAAERYFWWREYTVSTPNLTITLHAADSLNPNAWADVALTTSHTGLFHVVHRDTAGAFSHTTRAITDVFDQTARFEQAGELTDPNRGWQLAQISNIVGGSAGNTLTINALNITPATSTASFHSATTINDLYSPASIMVLETDEDVNLWVESGTGTNRAYRHDHYSSGTVREELTNVDLGYYTQGLTTPTALSSFDVNRVMVLDVIAPGVIDGNEVYEAVIWAVPYRVEVSSAPS